jgi:hypothetical protein
LTWLQIRQLAAVELRKRIMTKDGKMWLQNSQEIRNQIKANVLEVVVKENSFVLLTRSLSLSFDPLH